jgi:hypothetical protein
MKTFKQLIALASQQMEPRLQLAVEQVSKQALDLHVAQFANASRYEQWVDALRSAAADESHPASSERSWRTAH